jgi:hypothetical protein
MVLVPLGIAYGWVQRCACNGCHCGMSCRCPKYWYWQWTEAAVIASIGVVIGTMIFFAVRRRWRMTVETSS